MNELLLARHAETEWSADGRHTSRTDLPLTDNGRRQARRLAPRLADRRFAFVLSSPMRRAIETCELAGLGEEAEVRDAHTDAVAFGHGHMLRVLAARWLGLAPADGGLFALAAGTLSTLGYEHGTAVILSWSEFPS